MKTTEELVMDRRYLEERGMLSMEREAVEVKLVPCMEMMVKVLLGAQRGVKEWMEKGEEE